MKQGRPKKHGKKARQWTRVRAAWIKSHPPNHEGYYVCGICGRWVHSTEVEIDHIRSRSSAPQSVGDWANLQPTHSLCNRKKGSTHMEPFIPSAEYDLIEKLGL